MLTTGNQLRAARSLVDMDQSTLAERAGLNINTIGNMEKRGSETLVSSLDKIRSVMSVLEAAGVEFLNHGQPGVRLRKQKIDASHLLPKGPATDALKMMDAAIDDHRKKPKDEADDE